MGEHEHEHDYGHGHGYEYEGRGCEVRYCLCYGVPVDVTT